MNKKMRNKSIIILGVLFLSCVASKAQDTLCYEFNCDYLGATRICTTYRTGDSVVIVSDLFQETTASKNVAFRFQGNCVFLTIDEQEGIFWGNAQIGSWTAKKDESERFTVKWDSLYCPNTTEVIYQFEFVPYYEEFNPYITEDGTKIYHHNDDGILYYWTRSAGVIAFEGEWLFIRKDYEFLNHCILEFR